MPSARYPDDSPVDLPLQSMSKSLLVAIALLTAFIAVAIGVYVAGFSRTILVTQDGPDVTPAVRGEHVPLNATKASSANPANNASKPQAPSSAAATMNTANAH